MVEVRRARAGLEARGRQSGRRQAPGQDAGSFWLVLRYSVLTHSVGRNMSTGTRTPNGLQGCNCSTSGAMTRGRGLFSPVRPLRKTMDVVADSVVPQPGRKRPCNAPWPDPGRSSPILVRFRRPLPTSIGRRHPSPAAIASRAVRAGCPLRKTAHRRSRDRPTCGRPHRNGAWWDGDCVPRDKGVASLRTN